MSERQVKYCVACGDNTERYTKHGQLGVGRCIPCQVRRSANASAKKKQQPETPPPIAKAERKEWRKVPGKNGRPPNEARNKAIFADIDAGMDINDVAKKYCMTRQYVLIMISRKKREQSGILERVKQFEGIYAFRDAIIRQFVGGFTYVGKKHVGI